MSSTSLVLEIWLNIKNFTTSLFYATNQRLVICQYRSCLVYTVQSTEILMVAPKCEKKYMVLSNCQFLSIAPCKVALNLIF